MSNPTGALPTVDMLTPAEIQAKCENYSKVKCAHPTLKLFILAFMAGAFIAFGAMFYTLVCADADLSLAPKRVLAGVVFATGLYLVLCAGSELFTGDTMAVMGVWAKKITLGQLLRMLVIVWVGNLVGSIAIALLVHACNFGAMGGGAVAHEAVAIAAGKTGLPLSVMFCRGIMCNVLVCLAVWCSYGAKTTVDKFFSILLPIVCFVACGFEHSVANMYFLPAGFIEMMSGASVEGLNVAHLNMLGICTNLGVVTLANTFGAMVFIAGVYYFLFHKKED